MNSFETNRFAVLTFIVAPALLTNESSIMALGVGALHALSTTPSRFSTEVPPSVIRVVWRGAALDGVIRAVLG